MKCDYSILICGRISAGKTTVIKHLSKEFKIPVVSFGKMIKDIVDEAEKNPNRKQLQDYGYRLFSSIGAKKILEMAMDHSKNNLSKIIIFDGVRHESVVEEIKKISKKTLLIFLEANENLRFHRYVKYAGPSNLTLSDFHKIDDHGIERGINKLKDYSDLTIDASQPLEKVYSIAEAKVRSFIEN